MNLRLAAVALALLTLTAGAVAAPGSAGAAPTVGKHRLFAPVDKAGPPLTVPHAKLNAATKCYGDLAGSKKEPVLLSPATGVTPKQNYAWNYERAFRRQHRPFCTIRMPFHTLGNIEVAGEYLVHAIRSMYGKTHHHRIAVLGHSQGGMSMRWALRFWPGTRRMVADVIGMAGSNHGTTTTTACRKGVTRCPPATWQQASDARFIKALNSRAETFPGIAYTEIYTHTDEVVQPNSGPANSSSAVRGPARRVSNVATQDVCPTDVDEHLTIGTVDPVAYALVTDALTHRGPARPRRIAPSVCTQQYQPGVDPTKAQTYLTALAAIPGLLSVATPDANPVGAPEVKQEPKLRCYVFAAGCK